MKQLAVFIVLFFLIGCTSSDNSSVEPQSNQHVKLESGQGIEGIVEFWEGNFMPGPPSDLINIGSVTPVERTIYFYEPTDFDDVIQESNGVFFNKIQTNLIGTVQSDNDGQFEIKLKPGIYSVFIEENGLFYANGFSYIDGEYVINPVTVKDNQITHFEIKIDYKAAY